MRKVLMLLGTIALIGVVFAAFGVFRVFAADRESRAFVDDTLPRIVDGWDDRNLLAIATPELQQPGTRDELDRVFAMYRKLGRLLHVEPATGQATLTYTTRGRGIIGQYSANAEFENGPATISLIVVKSQDKWLIQRIQVTSKVLFQ
jgi:hypothetical protein